MSEVLAGLGWFFVVIAWCGIAYAILASVLAGRFMGKRSAPPTEHPSVTLLKPLHRDEPHLAENLASFVVQTYPAPVQIVFGVQDPEDPAIAIVEALKRERPDADIALVIDTSQHGTNAKVANLINMMAAAKHEVLVLSDADIAAPPGYLDQVVAALAAPGVGAVTCLYTGTPLPRLWSHLAAMWITYQFLPNVILGYSLGLASPCMGSTIALSRETLTAIGGFEALADCLADDYEIGRAVRATGARIAIPPLAVAHTCQETRPGEVIGHELRWARTIRTIDPGGHAGSLVTNPLPFALAACLMLGGAAPALWTLAATLAARFALRWRFDALFRPAATPAWLLPWRDVLSFAVLIASLFGNRIDWRGTSYRVKAGGVLTRS
jgi:ceramide glucosyltransferase